MNLLARWSTAVSAAIVALALFSGATQAQQLTAVAHVAKPATAPAVTHRVASKCSGLDETACSANPGCTWVAASKTKAGKEVKAHCRTKSTTGAAAKPGEHTKK